MSDGQMMFSPAVVKPIVAGIVSATLDRMILKNEDFNSNSMFGVSVAISTFAGDYIGESISNAMPDSTVYIFNGKSIIQRAVEIGSATGGAIVANKYVFSNNFDYDNMAIMRRVGVIALSQIAGEYFADYVSGKPLGYLA